MGEIVIIILEIVGTIAFDISGSLIAINCNLDILGITFMELLLPLVEGVLWDALIKKHSLDFFNTYIFAVAAVTAIIVFIILYVNRLHFKELKEKN